MDKVAYFKRSQELQLPLRCPLVGSCTRWAFSIYFNTYHKEDLKNQETVIDFLKRKGELSLDFDAKSVKLCGEHVISHNSDSESGFGQNLCPEIALFSDHRPLMLPKEAISSYSWNKYGGVESVEYTHFSECLEFIQTNYFQDTKTKHSEKILLGNTFGYVSEIRIQELKKIKSERVDLIKLIRLCEELNIAYANDLSLAVAMLLRAIIDHIPPIFSKPSFKEVISGYGGKSFKSTMQHLENGARKIADSHLHSHVRKKEVLPTPMQVNFSQYLDVLLAEVVVVMREEAT